MSEMIVYLHGKGGNAEEALHYKALFPHHEVLGFDYKAETPWEAQEEFPSFFRSLSERYESVSIIANSLGAFLAMSSLSEFPLQKAYFISPVVDMKGMIEGMMAQAGISRERLQQEKEIVTSFGEVLSWDYLRFVENHPLSWTIPTAILYGSSDFLTPRKTMETFSETIHASLTIMEEGEHWFHTQEQMAFLDNWIRSV